METSKKKTNVPDKPLKIVGTSISRTPSVSDLARGTPPRIDLSIDVDNPGGQPLHVWTQQRAYSYDASTHVLSVQLAEPEDTLPPNITMLSDHPRVPAQVVVNPKSSAKINLQVPSAIRRLTPGQGVGRSFVEEPIGQIDRVDLQIQHATQPVQYERGESGADFRKRLLAHGDVARATITPTTETQKKEER